MRFFNITPRRRDAEHAMSLRDELNNLFDSFFGENPLRRSTGAGEQLFIPQVDISANDTEVTVKADLPGMDATDIDLEVASDHLRLRGEKKSEYEETTDNVHRIERSFGAFERVVPLPVEVDSEKAKAEFRNGVLTITIARAEPTPKARKIDVQGS